MMESSEAPEIALVAPVVIEAPVASDQPAAGLEPGTSSVVQSGQSAKSSTEQTPTQPQVPEQKLGSPLQEYQKLQKDPQFQFKDGVQGLIVMMEKYAVIKDGKRLKELAEMDEETLKKQTEYVGLEVRNTADEKNRPDLMGPEFVLSKAQTVEDLKNDPRYKGKSVREAMALMQEEEKKKLEGELLQKKIEETIQKKAASSTEPVTQPSITPEEMAAITEEVQKTAAAKAQEKQTTFLSGAQMLVGDYFVLSMEETRIEDFLDIFFGSAVSRGNSWTRHRERGRENGGRLGDMVVLGEVEQHFKEKKSMVESINFTYEYLANLPGKSIRRPTELLDTVNFEKISKVDLQKILKNVDELMKADVQGVQGCIEKGIAKSMHKNENATTVDDRAFLMIHKLAEDQRSYDRFYDGFKDVKQSAKTP